MITLGNEQDGEVRGTAKSFTVDRLQAERGQIVVTLLVMGLVLGLVLVMAQQLVPKHHILADLTAKQKLSSVGVNVLTRIHHAFRSPAAGCPDLTTIKDFSSLESGRLEIREEEPTAGCFLSVEDAGRLSRMEIEIARMAGAEDLDRMSTTVSIRVRLYSKSSGMWTAKRFEVQKTYRLSVQRANFFNIVFTNSSPPLLSGQRVEVQGSALYAPRTPIRVSGIAGDYATRSTSNILFSGRFWARPDFLGETVFPLRLDLLHARFARGLVTGMMANVPTFPWDDRALWNIPIDYRYLYDPDQPGFPVPRLNVGVAANFIRIGNSGLSEVIGAFDPSRASISSLPNPSIFLDRVDKTCSASFPETGFLRSFVFMQPGRDFEVSFGGIPDDQAFCGMVRASTLKIRAPDPSRTYVMIGNFVVGSVVVEGSGRVVFLNPFENQELPPGVRLPDDRLLMDILSDFRHLGTSTARNFFVPFAYSPSSLPMEFQSGDLDRFFSECRNPLPGYRCWQAEIAPPDKSQLIPAHMNNLVYVLEAVI